MSLRQKNIIIFKIVLTRTQCLIKKLKEKMNNLFNSSAEDKFKTLNIVKELAYKSILPILRRGLKEMDPEIIELSASLIEKFK